MLKIRKRSGEEVLFDRSKIERAIEKANASVSIPERLDRDIIAGIALSIENACSNMKTIPTVESVQDMVEYAIAKAGAYRLAKNYAVYQPSFSSIILIGTAANSRRWRERRGMTGYCFCAGKTRSLQIYIPFRQKANGVSGPSI